MTVAEELREWAMRDEYPDQNTLTQEAWNELDSRWDTSYHLRPDDWRTFALLVAEALESEEMKKQITLSLPRPAHIKVHTDSQGFQYWDEPFYSADQVEEIRRAAILAERERHAEIVLQELGDTGQARAIAAAIREGGK